MEYYVTIPFGVLSLVVLLLIGQVARHHWSIGRILKGNIVRGDSMIKLWRVANEVEERLVKLEKKT